MDTELIPVLIIGCIILPISIIGLFYSLNYQKNLKKKGINNLIKVKHFYGLSLPENARAVIYEYSDKFTFISNGISFSLLKDKITDISINKDTDIQKHYVSSTGGAIGGAMLFGPLGALIGGRVKTKNTYSIDYYLIFTYLKNNEPSYIAFNCNGKVFEAKKITKQYKSKQIENNVTIDL